ncbi:Linear gramicidin synthase subunit B [Planctomycetes bacterium Poly30]|uniref:Linear gramicidin synthase subunit B n=1 Tax=Saltatorellus ferox TaxID=2528018 RepID=A0A518F1A3_9BACT|nr:Linear gramicidin synthase subunit B [Planctomycetes bacterium Poly30]
MENVEDLIPLTPMQRVMLLRALSTGGQEALFQQFVFEIHGVLDPAAFLASWASSVECHSSLRTAFLWRGLKQPLQVIRKEASIPYRYIDHTERGGGAAQKDAATAEFLEEDRATGFDLGVAPLMRIALLRWSETEWTFVWTSHHLVLDRWSIAPLLDDVWRSYDAAVEGDDASRGAGASIRRSRYRDYVAWVEKQDATAAETFWGERLAGVEHATRRLTRPSSEAATGQAVASHTFRLDPLGAEALRAAARSSNVTPGAVLQAAWALTMAKLNASADVCFGLTVSGRPPGVPAIERMIGSFIGNVPVRVQLAADLTARGLCQSLLREGQSRIPFEYLAPTDFHRIAELPAGEPLFDSLVLWLSRAESRDPGGLTVRAVPGEAATAWPLTISVLEEGAELVVAVRTAASTSLRDEHSLADLGNALEHGIGVLVRLLGDAPQARLRDHFPWGEPGGGDHSDVSAPAAARRRATRLPAEPTVDAGGREFDDPEMLRDLLYEECQALLPTDARIDPKQGFFEQGGTSMLAAQLHARLEALTGRALPMLELFEAPTLEAMAKELASKPWPLLGGVLRAVRRDGSRPPLFCVSSPEVNSLGYVTLSRHLDDDQPVYLAQGRPSGADAVFRMAVSDIPRLARDSVDAIQKQFPDGPYRLFGMCDGALVAFEMARLLEERGADVEFLCLLNTYALGTLSRRYKVKRAVTRADYYRRRFREKLVKKLEPKVSPARRVDAASTPNSAPKSVSESTSIEASAAGPTLADRLARINGEWFEFDTPRHLPKQPTFQGRITVLRNTAQPYWRIRDEALGWRAYSSDVEVLDLQAEREAVQGPERRGQQDAHMALLREPDIQQVARALNERLRALDRAERSEVEA